MKKKIIPITEAIETLESIVDLGEKEHREFGLTMPELKERHRIHVEDLRETLTVERIKAIFTSIHQFIESKVGDNEKVKSIMLLVGEAAHKLDRFRDLFHLHTNKSITELAEYVRLKYLYAHKIEKRVDENLLGKWIMGLVGVSEEEKRKERMRKQEPSRHVFIDLDMVKRDKEYELLFIRKEDGTRFFNPRLLRNIRIVCTFGNPGHDSENLFFDLSDWKDQIAAKAAVDILKSSNLAVKQFYAEAYRHKEVNASAEISKALMALMLASRARPVDEWQRLEGAKGSFEYFTDFIQFLREGLTSRSYQKMLLDPPSGEQKILSCIYTTLQQLSRALFLHLHLLREMAQFVDEILSRAERAFPTTTKLKERGALIWSKLAYDYAEILKVQKTERAETMKRLLDSIESEGYLSFDPLLQFNLSFPLYTIRLGDKETPLLHLASPTHQTFINRAGVLDEFKAYLLSKDRLGEDVRHLLINLQDRTSWREHARATAVEQLSVHDPFKKHLEVITLSTDTPFYHQEEPYRDLEQAEEFFDVVDKQLGDESAGFFFPDSLKSQLKAASPKIQKAIWELFFEKRSHLSQKERQDFISLFYLFLSLKALDLVRPTSMSFSCKDALDIGTEFNLFLYIFFKALRKEEIEEDEMKMIKTILFSAPLLVRERAMLAQRFNRMLSLLQLWERREEAIRDKLAKSVSSFLSKDLLSGEILSELLVQKGEILKAA